MKLPAPFAFAVVTDLDGTVLPRPGSGRAGGLGTPPLGEGPAHGPLLRLLERGCTVVGATGSKLATHRALFWDELPVEARRSGRVLLSVESGRRLYRGSPEDGTPVEDAAFTAFSSSRAPPFEERVVAELVEVGRAGIRSFWADASRDRSLLDPGGPHAGLCGYLGSADAADPPVTNDSRRYPRVEVRDSAVVFLGVPVSFGRQYFEVPPGLSDRVSGKPTGRYCFDCTPPGLSKALLIEFLTAETRELAAGRALALGDQPLGNDEGLTRWHASGALPFVSVSESRAMVPEHLAACHVTRLANEEASAAVFTLLAETLERHAGPAELSTSEVSRLVQQLNAMPAACAG